MNITVAYYSPPGDCEPEGTCKVCDGNIQVSFASLKVL